MSAARKEGFVEASKKDYLVGKEYFCQESLGNETVRNLRDQYYDEYGNAKIKRRKEIKATIYQGVTDGGGRFLKRVKGDDGKVLGWKEMSKRDALECIGGQFKNKNRQKKPTTSAESEAQQNDGSEEMKSAPDSPESSLSFSNIFQVIGVDPRSECAMKLLSSFDDNFESVQNLMAFTESAFEAQLRGYGFDGFAYCRLRDFRIWFSMWYLPAPVKPPLTNETWLAFKEARRSGGLFGSDCPSPTIAATPPERRATSPVVDDSSDNPQEGDLQPIDDFIIEVDDEVSDDEMLRAIEKGYQDDHADHSVDYTADMSLMIHSIGTMSLSSSHKQQAQDLTESEAEKAGKRGSSAVSIGSKSNGSDRKPPAKKAAMNVAKDASPPEIAFNVKDLLSHHVVNPTLSSKVDSNPLLGLLTGDESGEAQRPQLDLPTIAEDGAVATSGEVAANIGEPSRQASSTAGSAPLSQVLAGSLGNVSSFTSTEGQDQVSEEKFRGAGVLAADFSVLRPTTRDDRKISVLSISSQQDIEGNLRAIIKRMKLGLNNATVQIRCCGDISEVVWANESDIWEGTPTDPRRLILRQGLTQSVLRAMWAHPDDPKLMKYALKAVDDLCKDSSESFVKETYIKIVSEAVKSMKRAPNNASTQQSASFALAKLAGDKQSGETIIEVNGVHHILVAMQKHLPSAQVQKNGCVFLLKLSDRYERRKAIPAEHVVRVVLQMMTSHSSSGDLQQQGCVLLSRFYKCNGSTLIGAEGVSAVVGAMQNHGSRGRLLRHACWLFGNLAYENDECRAVIVAGQGIPAVVTAMQQNVEETQVQVEGCRALSMLAYGRNADVCRQIVTDGGITVVADAMERHKTNEDVQKYCCWAFQNLAEGDSPCRSQIQDQGGVRLMKRAKSCFPNLAWDVKAALRPFGVTDREN